MKCKWRLKNNDDISCNSESDESGYCVLHKINKTKEENECLIKYIKENELNEISGFVFEEEFNANDAIKYKYNALIFREVIFMDNANFKEFEFRENVVFENVKFLTGASFRNSKFLSSCRFINCTFSKVESKDKIFLDTLFIGQNLEFRKIKDLPRLDGIKFDAHTKIIMNDVEYEKPFFINGKINYRIARNQATKIGDSERIGYYYYKERYYGSKSMKKEEYPTYEHYISSKFFDTVSKYVIGYGEKPWNVLISTITTISIFAIIYMFVGIEDVNNGYIGVQIKNIGSYKLSEVISMYTDLWYFSMITFSTVGYGDMIPINDLGKMLVTMEVFFGITIGAAWTSVIIKRMIK